MKEFFSDADPFNVAIHFSPPHGEVSQGWKKSLV